MNVYDTEVGQGLLASRGYEIVHPDVLPGAPQNTAEPEVDVVLMNTCSVREHAEERVYGRLGILAQAKKQNPELIVGLMGCMVEEHRESLFKRFPHLDLMVGTRNVRDLPDLLDEVRRTRQQAARIRQDGLGIEYTDQIRREGLYHAWLPVMTGCNKVCTFCIVPITRGSEVSMPAREVYREASRLAKDGVKWITLLGQNVNSYRGGAGNEEVGFPELLETLSQIDGLERISFTTSHPHDATEELYRVIRDNPKISRRFHLPLQSGSNRILKRMKRLHTYEEYRAKIERMREMIPGISVTTDIIAGFSGETEEDHRATERALEELRYDGAYIYKYSVRPATPAAKLPDDVPLEVKEARNAGLLGIQKRITKENHENQLGKTVTVFVESASDRLAGHLRARADDDRRILFPASEKEIGSFRPVRLVELRGETFLAEPVSA